MAMEDAKGLEKVNQLKLDDIWWDTRGPGQIVPKYGDDGKVIGGTSAALEIGWLATNFARLFRRLDEILLTLRNLAIAQGAVIDYDLIAKKVVDEEARRMSQAALETPPAQPGS